MVTNFLKLEKEHAKVAYFWQFQRQKFVIDFFSEKILFLPIFN